MPYTPKDGQGALFKNDKGGVDTRPDYKGNVLIAGTEYELAAWIKEGQRGKYMSISAKPKGERSQRPRSREPGEDFDNEPAF